MNSFHEQYSFNAHPSTMDAITDYPRILPHDGEIDWLINPSQIMPDIIPSPHGNALGLYEMYGHESDWPADLLACPPGHWKDDTHYFTPSFLHQPTPDTAMHFGQPLVPCYTPVRVDTTATRLWETPIPHPIQESYPVPKPMAYLPDNHIKTPRPLTQSMAASLRHKRYLLRPDGTKRATFPVHFYQCRWTDGTSPCGAVVAGNKNAIGRHLQVAHGIRLKADKTDEVCLWDKCQKSMRRESMSRHILTVHMQDKVHCSRCGSQFARPDSLQRHQRTCLATGEDPSDACKMGGRTALI